MLNESLKRPLLLIKLTSGGFLLFAFCWWLAVIPALDWPARLILDVSDWPVDSMDKDLSRQSRFLSAIGSGLLAGLSGFLLFVVLPELQRGNARAATGAIASILCWYFVDSAGCALLGIHSNVLLNSIYVCLIVPPLLMARRAIVSAG